VNHQTGNNTIKAALDRLAGVYRKKPATALSTCSVAGIIEKGMLCRITDGAHDVVTDLPEPMGGEDAGPTPGFFVRAGLAGCVAIGIKMEAARAGYEFKSINVQVETDHDDRAFYGLGDKSAAPLETRLAIKIDSDLDEDTLSVFVNDVLDRDTWFVALRDAQRVKASIVSTMSNKSKS
jgi:uncharacterized OsmC-like protein